MKRLLALLLCLTLVFGMSAIMAGCGSSDTSSESAEAAAGTDESAADDESFMYGSWIAQTATVDGNEMDAYEFFNKNTVSWYFAEDGEATLWAGQNHAPLTWELKENGVTLQGDLTYEADFTDETKTALMWHYDVNDVKAEVLMEHYIEDEGEPAE